MIDWGLTNEGSFFIVQEKLDKTLEQLVQERFLSLREKSRVGLAWMNIIESIHDLGFVHRDIKPNNLMISGLNLTKQRVFLIDFGRSMRYLDS